MKYHTISNMASKVDEESEEGRESVVEHLQKKEEKDDEFIADEVTNDKGSEERYKLPENAQIVEEVIGNFSGEESESETFQDAVEDLNEKMDSCKTPPDGGGNDDEIQAESEVVEEEERLTPEEKEVWLII